jgi:hypothetical protein
MLPQSRFGISPRLSRGTYMKQSRLIVAVAAVLLMSGCVSARPRPYTPVVQPPPFDQAAFERAFASCASAVSAGERNFGQSTSAAVVGAAGTVATVEVLGGAAAATTVGGGGALAATGVGLLVLVPLTTYALSSARRRKNEREVQTAMTSCLAPQGYIVTSWNRLSQREAAVLTVVTPTRAAAR